MACASPAYIGATHWFLFVAVTSFISTLIWCTVYLLSIREVLKVPINWILTVSYALHKTRKKTPVLCIFDPFIFMEVISFTHIKNIIVSFRNF